MALRREIESTDRKSAADDIVCSRLRKYTQVLRKIRQHGSVKVAAAWLHTKELFDAHERQDLLSAIRRQRVEARRMLAVTLGAFGVSI